MQKIKKKTEKDINCVKVLVNTRYCHIYVKYVGKFSHKYTEHLLYL